MTNNKLSRTSAAPVNSTPWVQARATLTGQPSGLPAREEDAVEETEFVLDEDRADIDLFGGCSPVVGCQQPGEELLTRLPAVLEPDGEGVPLAGVEGVDQFDLPSLVGNM